MNFRGFKGFSMVRQRDTMQCGVACLAMICRAYGEQVSGNQNSVMKSRKD